MTVSDASLEEFIALWEVVYGERLSTEQARPIAIRLVRLFRLIMRPSHAAAAPPSRNEREAP